MPDITHEKELKVEALFHSPIEIKVDCPLGKMAADSVLVLVMKENDLLITLKVFI